MRRYAHSLPRQQHPPKLMARRVKATAWGVVTPLQCNSVADYIGAGWHARMSSRQR